MYTADVALPLFGILYGDTASLTTRLPGGEGWEEEGEPSLELLALPSLRLQSIDTHGEQLLGEASLDLCLDDSEARPFENILKLLVRPV